MPASITGCIRSFGNLYPKLVNAADHSRSKPYQVAAYHHIENGTMQLDYQTLEEAEAAAQGYVAGTMEKTALHTAALLSMTPETPSLIPRLR